jgi:hypothetical protein
VADFEVRNVLGGQKEIIVYVNLLQSFGCSGYPLGRHGD